MKQKLNYYTLRKNNTDSNIIQIALIRSIQTNLIICRTQTKLLRFQSEIVRENLRVEKSLNE